MWFCSGTGDDCSDCSSFFFMAMARWFLNKKLPDVEEIVASLVAFPSAVRLWDLLEESQLKVCFFTFPNDSE